MTGHDTIWCLQRIDFVKFYDQKWPDLARIFGSCVARGLRWLETTCIGRDFWIEGCSRLSLTGNDLPWQGCLDHKLLEVYRWPETTCFGRDFWIMSCLRFIVDQKRPALAGIIGSCVAWDFSSTRNDLPWQEFLNHLLLEVFRLPETTCLGRNYWIMCCLRFFVDQKRSALAGIVVPRVGFCWPEMTCFSRDFWILCCYRWPETTCAGRDFWILCCLGFFVDQRRSA